VHQVVDQGWDVLVKLDREDQLPVHHPQRPEDDTNKQVIGQDGLLDQEYGPSSSGGPYLDKSGEMSPGDWDKVLCGDGAGGDDNGAQSERWAWAGAGEQEAGCPDGEGQAE